MLNGSVFKYVAVCVCLGLCKVEQFDKWRQSRIDWCSDGFSLVKVWQMMEQKVLIPISFWPCVSLWRLCTHTHTHSHTHTRCYINTYKRSDKRKKSTRTWQWMHALYVHMYRLCGRCVNLRTLWPWWQRVKHMVCVSVWGCSCVERDRYWNFIGFCVSVTCVMYCISMLCDHVTVVFVWVCVCVCISIVTN